MPVNKFLIYFGQLSPHYLSDFLVLGFCPQGVAQFPGRLLVGRQMLGIIGSISIPPLSIKIINKSMQKLNIDRLRG